MKGLSGDDVYRALLERQEISIISLSQVRNSFMRFDSDYYSHENLSFQKIVSGVDGRTVKSIGGILDCSAFYPSITGYYSNDRKLVPFLRVNEISNGLVVITDKTVFLPQEVLDKNSKTIASAYPGDIVIAKGGNTLAKVGLVTDEYPYYATCRDVIILRTDSLMGINKYFLWTFLHSKYGQGLMWRASTQTGQPHLTLPAILNLHIPEFSLTLQNKCEELYRKSVSCKIKAQEIYASAEKELLKELGINEWIPLKEQISVRSFGNVTQTGRIDAEYYQPKYDELIDKIAAHNARRLWSVVDIKKSIEPGSEEYQYEGIPFYRISDFSEFGLTEPKIYLDTKKYLNVIMPKKNTILLSKDGSVCIAYKVEKDIVGITSSALLHLRIKDNSCLPDYLTLVLNSKVVRLQAERSAGGSIIQHWRMEDINDVLIPVIEYSIQQEISKKVESSFQLRHQSVLLLDVAKHAVEIAIEQDEDVAIKFLDNQLQSIEKDD